MKDRFQEQLTNLTTCLMKAHKQSETIRLVEEVNAIMETLIKLNSSGTGKLFERKEITVLYRIDKSEFLKMDKAFKKEFCRCPNVRLTKRKLDSFKYAYEIRYRSNNYTITAIADSLDEAKQKFLDMTKTENIKNYREFNHNF